MTQLFRPLYTLLIIFLVCVGFSGQSRPLVDIAIANKLSTVKPIQAVNHPEVGTLATISAPTPIVITSNVVANCGDNSYMQYIYMHETGCKLVDPNGSGCDGIGQSCPASKIYNACPNMDYACQNAFYDNYAISAYGSEEAAYNHELNWGWW